MGALRNKAQHMCRNYPHFVLGFKALGVALLALDKRSEALAAMRQAVRLAPGDDEALSNLGQVLSEEKQYDEAITVLRQALSINPSHAVAVNNLAVALLKNKKPAESLEMVERAVALAPDYALAHNTLSAALVADKQIVRGIESARHALRLDPRMADAYNNLGTALRLNNQNMAAVDAIHASLLFKPDCAEALNNYAAALLNVGEIEKAHDVVTRAMQLAPDDLAVQCGHLLLDNYHPDFAPEHMGKVARTYAKQVSRQIRPQFSFAHLCQEAQAADNDKNSNGRRLRVGLVSGDLKRHAVSTFLLNLIDALAQINAPIDFFAYATKPSNDEVSARLKSHMVRWTAIESLNDDEAARCIHGDGIHILFDLSGYTDGHRLCLFARKPAPVAVTWLGWFASTGITAIDYILVDHVSVPNEHAAVQFVERPWYLPHCTYLFTPWAECPAVAPAPYTSNNGIPTLGSFVNPNKVGNATLDLWARVLHAIPHARFLWMRGQLGEEKLRESFMAKFSERGIAPQRVTLAANDTLSEYLNAYGQVDFVIDPTPVSGGTTTCEALYMGVPTLTLSHSRMPGRLSTSMLSALGLHDWITDNADDYVQRAQYWCSHLSDVAALRQGLRQQMQQSTLLDAKRFAENFYAALNEMWQHFYRENGQV